MSDEKNGMQLHPLQDGRPGLRAQVGVSVAVGPRFRSGDSTDGDRLDFIASTGALDRYGEIIDPDGWKLESYKANPVFQNAHRYGDVMHTLGRAEDVGIRSLSDGRRALYMRVQFATEVNPIARVAYGLYAGGFLNAVSVGFIPLKWVDGGPKDEWFRKYIEQELCEVSAVAVPANREALKLGLKTGVISRSCVQDALEVLGGILRECAESQGRKSVSRDLLNWGRELRAAMAGAQ